MQSHRVAAEPETPDATRGGAGLPGHSQKHGPHGRSHSVTRSHGHEGRVLEAFLGPPVSASQEQGGLWLAALPLALQEGAMKALSERVSEFESGQSSLSETRGAALAIKKNATPIL